MSRLRRLLFARRHAALWLIAAALLARALIPAGYMIDTSGGGLAVTLCSGTGPMTMAMPIPAGHGDGHDADRHKAEPPCVFASLVAPALASADPILLALAIAYIVAAFARTVRAPRVEPRPRLRPPLRGPPAAA